MTRRMQDRFTQLENEVQQIIADRSSEYSTLLNSMETYVDQARYNRWLMKARKLIEDSYGKDSTYYDEFVKAESAGYMSTNHTLLTRYIVPVFDAAKEDLQHQDSDASSVSIPNILDSNPFLCVENMCQKFPLVARQLRQRHGGRQTIEIKDEYDVQDLFHSLLKLHFDDIRAEECTPSYAGSASRVDFLLKKEKLVIEIKKTRNNLGAKEIGNELTIDIARYHAHPDCETLVCFVYDPDGRINNPIGVESDLEAMPSNIKIKVIIVPK